MSLMLDLCSWIGRLRKEEYGGEKRREEKRREEKRDSDKLCYHLATEEKSIIMTRI